MLQGRIMQDQEMCTTHSGRIDCLTDRIPDHYIAMIRATLLFITLSTNFTDPFAVNFKLRRFEIRNWHLLLGREKMKNFRYSNLRHNMTENNEGEWGVGRVDHGF